ncbi:MULTISPECIES: hypothetical protein [unclassified Pseudomonas]|uniref:hypothetical protein n=1 Tax=unclassified Pseudomonas TaxID=196821 RepID=UPI002117BCDD|nr:MULTISPECIES: hypothetical protein [unclassified Pseudomonas]
MSTQTVSQEQLNLLWHTLGLSPDNRYRRTVTRNHFLTSPGCDDGRHLDGLVAKGLMLCGKPPAFCPQDEVVYRATRDGEHFALAHLPALPKPTRYEQFQSEDTGLDFHEWLGIEKPKVEYRERCRILGHEAGCRMHTDRATGEWCKTKKEAKASYKAVLAATKAKRLEAA